MKTKSNKKNKMSPLVLEMIASKFKVLSEPLRLAIVQYLMEGQKNVSDIHTHVQSSQPNVSKHLRLLEQAGYVGKRKQGVTVYYYIIDPMVFKLCELVCNGLAKDIHEQSQKLKALKKNL